jgi:hypothetical protein
MLLAVLACAPDPASNEPTKTSTPTTFSEVVDPTCAPYTATDPVVTAASAECVDGALVVTIDADAWTGTGRLLVAAGPDQVELQPVETIDYDPCGGWDHLGLTLRSTGATWQLGSSTAFSCEEFAADPPALTFAAAVTAWSPPRPTESTVDQEPLADCLAWGADVEGLQAGDYDGALAPEIAPEGGFGICHR